MTRAMNATVLMSAGIGAGLMALAARRACDPNDRRVFNMTPRSSYEPAGDDALEGIPMARGASWPNWAANGQQSGLRLVCAGSAIAAAFLAFQATPSQRDRRQLKRTIRQVARLHDREPARTA